MFKVKYFFIMSKSIPGRHWVHCKNDTLLKKFCRISLYVTDDANAKLNVMQSLVKYKEMVEHFVT